MEPLIDLPELAKARIRAKEAKAEEHLNVLRHACAADIARANSRWGGYFDLYQEQLAEARAHARAQLDEGGLLAAQLVFSAHSMEYRATTTDSTEFKSVMVLLREAVIKEYGEQTRMSVQSLEAQEIQKKEEELDSTAGGGVLSPTRRNRHSSLTEIGVALEPPSDSASEDKSSPSETARRARAQTVGKLIKELDCLRPQMFEDENEYKRLVIQYPDFLAFKIAGIRPDLKLKILSIQGSIRHVRLAQELAGAHYGRKLSTIQKDWKNFKPTEFKQLS